MRIEILLCLALPALAVTACDSGGTPFTALSQEPETVRSAFLRGRHVGGTARVVDVTSRVPAFDVRTAITDGDEMVYPDAVEIVARILAGEGSGGDLLIRSPTSRGLCGETKYGQHACLDMIFVPDAVGAHERWALLVVPQGEPEVGSWAIVAGREVPEDADPVAVLRDMETTE
jgi:hypothetical protein